MKANMAQTATAKRNQKNLAADSRRQPSGETRSLAAAELSRQLRCASDGFLAERRGIVALSLLAIGALGLISLYQVGIVKHLPEPPLPKLDAERIDGSPEAYERLSAPDATLGVSSYAATLALAAMGGANRSRERPWLSVALAAKVGFDLAQSLRMLRIQWTKYRAFCFWCLVSAAATFATVPLVFGETRAALRRLTK